MAIVSGQQGSAIPAISHIQTMSSVTELPLHSVLLSPPFSFRNASFKILKPREKRVDYSTHSSYKVLVHSILAGTLVESYKYHADL